MSALSTETFDRFYVRAARLIEGDSLVLGGDVVRVEKRNGQVWVWADEARPGNGTIRTLDVYAPGRVLERR